jgi:hypothetical protein
MGKFGMGKKSLIKSTSKKKTAAKKTGPAKKTAAVKKAAGKKAAKKKAAPKKAAPQKKAAPKKAAAQKAAPKKTVAKTLAAKKSAPKKAPAKKRTVKELLNQKFEWPQTGKAVKVTRTAVKFNEPPPFIASQDKKEGAAIKAILRRSFDMAEIKAAGEKASTEKAAQAKTASEKAAVEKATTEKAAAEKVKVSYTEPATPAVPPAPPVDRTGQYLTFGAAGIAILLFLLVIGASLNNADSYYIKPAAGAIEIWQGKFAPLGKKLLVTLPGVPAPEEIQPQYDKQAVFPLISGHYISKADALLAAPGFPDFEEIKKYLEKALKFAHSQDLRDSVYARIDGIDIAIYMYKANVAASRGTTADLEFALDYLASAAALNPDENLLELIKQKKVLFSEAIADNQTLAEAEAIAAEEALAAQQAAADAEAEPAAPQEPGPAEGQPAADH